MNRYFIAFLVFVGALLTAGAVLGWWFAPQVALFLDEHRREGPAVVFDFSGLAATGKDNPAQGREILTRLVHGEGGRFHYHGELLRLLDGQLHTDSRQFLDIYSLKAGADYLRLSTHADYRKLTSADGSRLVLAGVTQASANLDTHAGSVRVVWLFERRAGQAFDEIESFLGTVRAHGGVPAIRTEVRRIEGEPAWVLLLAFEFPGEPAAMAWFRDLRTQTELAVMKARYGATAGLLYGPPQK